MDELLNDVWITAIELIAERGEKYELIRVGALWAWRFDEWDVVINAGQNSKGVAPVNCAAEWQSADSVLMPAGHLGLWHRGSLQGVCGPFDRIGPMSNWRELIGLLADAVG